MHQREVLAAGGGTLTDTMHIVFTGTPFLMMLAIGYASAVFGRVPRLPHRDPVASGVLIGLESPGIHTGQPTPLIGVWERITIAAFLLWIIVFRRRALA